MMLLLVFGLSPWLTTSSYAAAKVPTPKGVLACGVSGKAVITWEKVKTAEKYLVYQSSGDGSAGNGLTKNEISELAYAKVAETTGTKVVLSDLKKGLDYHYYVVACRTESGKQVQSERSRISSTTVAKKGKSTIKNLLRTGLAPVGSTLYVWGGGWNKADNGTGKTAKRNGLYPAWRSFFKKNSSKYNYRNHRYKIMKGLDCSGFVGWSVYNNMETKDGRAGYVTWAVRQGKWFAKKGFGKYVSKSKVTNHKAGDIMTCSTHVWMAVGDCSDGSTVILHASPPAVSLAGTPASDGKKNSKAAKLARKYMKKYYGSLYKKYPSMVYRPASYSNDYGRMRWNSKTLSDPEGYRKMSADKVLKDLFAER